MKRRASPPVHRRRSVRLLFSVPPCLRGDRFELRQAGERRVPLAQRQRVGRRVAGVLVQAPQQPLHAQRDPVPPADAVDVDQHRDGAARSSARTIQLLALASKWLNPSRSIARSVCPARRNSRLPVARPTARQVGVGQRLARHPLADVDGVHRVPAHAPVHDQQRPRRRQVADDQVPRLPPRPPRPGAPAELVHVPVPVPPPRSLDDHVQRRPPSVTVADSTSPLRLRFQHRQLAPLDLAQQRRPGPVPVVVRHVELAGGGPPVGVFGLLVVHAGPPAVACSRPKYRPLRVTLPRNPSHSGG